jgi:hypothetical protein
MPEILTRHPEVVIQVLRGYGAKCGEGAPQQILKTCPKERFCTAPAGELCVYGLDQVHLMTQITLPELRRAAGAGSRAGPEVFISVFLALVAGLVIGGLISRRMRKDRGG